MNLTSNKNLRILVIAAFAIIVLVGITMRFYHITKDEFFFFDEGYYINYNRKIIDLVSQNYPKNFTEFTKVFKAVFKASLASAKPLWFFIVNIRVFAAGADAWWFPRLVSAISGVATLLFAFLFARRYFNSGWIAILSVSFLAVMPSHVFYSRLGLQESLSILLFTCGFYLYLFPRKFNYRLFISGVLFAGAYFTNYRLITIPILILFYESYSFFILKKEPNFRKYLWNTLTFLFFIIVISNLYGGHAARITFGWMLYQSQLAEGQKDLLSFFSYPYYVFKLESVFFAVLFFANLYYLFERKFSYLAPFLVSIFMMLMFSFSQDKAIRYISICLPLICMSAAYSTITMLKEKKNEYLRIVVIVIVCFAFIALFSKSLVLAKSRSDYKTSIDYLNSIDPSPKIISTQKFIQNLYAEPGSVTECPKQYRHLFVLYSQGYRYLILDPQAYISWTEEKLKFNKKLIGYLNYVRNNTPPLKTFPHFNEAILERFVFDHNENLGRSISFLQMQKKGQFGTLRVYDLKKTLGIIKKQLEVYKAASEDASKP